MRLTRRALFSGAAAGVAGGMMISASVFSLADEALGRGESDRASGSIPVGGIPLDRDL